MIRREQYEKAREKALGYFKKAGMILTQKEQENLEVADFGRNDLKNIGMESVTYVNTERCCAKELVLFPNQTCPEHRHPPVPGGPGKEETFRCRWGEVYLYVEGEPAPHPKAQIPAGYEKTFTVLHEIILKPGQQYTLQPNTRHWFQAGKEGTIVSEFSTSSRDESDIFTDQSILRMPEIL